MGVDEERPRAPRPPNLFAHCLGAGSHGRDAHAGFVPGCCAGKGRQAAPAGFGKYDYSVITTRRHRPLQITQFRPAARGETHRPRGEFLAGALGAWQRLFGPPRIEGGEGPPATPGQRRVLARSDRRTVRPAHRACGDRLPSRSRLANRWNRGPGHTEGTSQGQAGSGPGQRIRPRRLGACPQASARPCRGGLLPGAARRTLRPRYPTGGDAASACSASAGRRNRRAADPPPAPGHTEPKKPPPLA